MSVQLSCELRDFHLFVGEQLARNTTGLTPEDALDLWRDQHPITDVPEDMEQSVKALQAALADMHAGDTGIPAADFHRQFRAKHGLPVGE